MKNHYQLPILIEKDEDGFYVVECPVFSGCYTQGETMEEALKNIREVIAFPKTGDNRDLMMDAPSEVDDKQLKELHINIKKKK